ncbi:hypothetical protein QR680_017826 [Steinernema hermaphroditum]|uniref:Uncharacterized protein n=1 Tax=Steinernema hermaphroditum TaxID=289476 RepID=A0AA39LPD0_9BILA|nr:hypothetical protein QR680_017826 [Steinernema hermaphroditum]
MTVHLGIGIVSIVAFSFFFPCNLIIVWIITTKGKLRKLWAFVIILHTAILDIGYIQPILTTGLMSLLGVSLPNSIVVGSYYIMTAFPATQAALNLSLALNRMFVFTEMRHLNKAIVYWILLSISWLSGVVWIVLTALIKADFIFDLNRHTLLMIPIDDQEKLSQERLNTAKIYFTLVCFGFGFFCYIITIFSIFRKKSNELSKTELRIFVQASVLFVGLAITRFAAHYSYAFTMFLGNYVGAVVGLVFYRLMPCTINTAINLVVNKSIRGSIIDIFRKVLLKRLKPNSVSSVITVKNL